MKSGPTYGPLVHSISSVAVDKMGDSGGIRVQKWFPNSMRLECLLTRKGADRYIGHFSATEVTYYARLVLAIAFRVFA